MVKGLKGEIDQRPRKFYQAAGVRQVEGGWQVELDGKPIRTGTKAGLVVPTLKLAEALAEEWNAQVERIDFASMWLTRLANVAIDRTPGTRAELVAEAARYAETDLVCHLADRPDSLRAEQEAAWAPLRAWAADAHGVRLTPVTGIMAARQPEASLEAMRDHAGSLDDFRLTGLVYGVGLMGSAVLGLAVERRRLSAVEAHEVSRVDEIFQARQWGEDAEAQKRVEGARVEARALDRWFDALDGGDVSEG
jgi:chaperone required for assembly of F1-ATPase